MGWEFKGRRIGLARESRGLTQRDLSIMLGISPQQVSYWETGRSMPGQASLTKICNALEVPPMFFFVQSGNNVNTDEQDEHTPN